ncbi:beta-lactamase domain protein [Catenulispora acidiphila DSM 44928]|uniref:Beta-lactamase domain protein n=1 Tax=Catenulispora acidiphila (strain DSM 44928 / JCM 14897 / NBRC 102108 / NRRL B-24433 / ID139908) TaxID=479433 RepID=C7QHU9_CATAD|nr:MBL fold metallo-hydrolase [Catenulispora acidiphila]ACU71124.1 beta-lactamase domain protein [Catenulispora acidiphila DSM 44928]
MRVTVLGGSGAFPTADSACSGFLLHHDGFSLLVDAGYAVLPRLLELMPAEQLDAVYISHGHPDHCADLNPLLRARAFGGADPDPLPVYAPPRALDAVLALDRPGMLDAALTRHDFEPGAAFSVGPFELRTALLPHWLPNAAVRVAAGGHSVVYTGDGGPDPALVELARGADTLIAEASYPEVMDADSVRYLSTARQVARQASEAGVGRLVLTHLMPGSEPGEYLDAAAKEYTGRTGVATGGLSFDA